MTEPRKLAIVFLIIMALGLIVLAIEWLRLCINAWISLVLLALVLLALALMLYPVAARDLDGRYAQSPLKPWFDQLKSGKGPCCSDADGDVVKDADWEVVDGRFRVRVEDQWVTVDSDAIITESNRYGRTMVWLMHKDGKPIVRCFMPGAMI